MEKLSAVIITFNEERNISRCLASLRDVADDIVVVDSESTDRTRQICLNHGARVLQRAWTNYSEQKNYGNSQAAYDWILSIDADEALSPELIKSIQEVKRSFRGHSYRINRLTNYCGQWIKHCGWYPDKKARLFDRRSARWEGQFIHEKLVLDDTPSCPLLKGDCFHFSYYSIEEHIRKTERYSRLAADALLNAGKKFSLFAAITRPLFKFMRVYVLHLGFWDGYHGFAIALLSGYGAFLKYARLHPRWSHAAPAEGMRILHVDSERLWRGGEQQVSYLLHGLPQYGAQQFVACRRGSALESHCKKLGISHVTLPFYNQLDIRSAALLKRYCRDNNISLLHLHSGHAHSIAVLAHIMGNNVPMILSRRVAFPIRKNFFSRFKYNFDAICKVVCVSQTVRDEMAKALLEPDKCEVLHSSIDTEKYCDPAPSKRFRRELSIPDNATVIANIGALTKEKDHKTFIEAAKLLSHLPNLCFVIIGGGPLRNELKRRIDKLGLTGRVLLAGPRNDISEILPCINLLLFTSRAEGCPNVIVEAFAAKVPVVAADAPGTMELVAHEECGLLAAAGNAAALAAAVERCLGDAKLRDRLTANGYLKGMGFSKEKMVERTHSIYREALNLL